MHLTGPFECWTFDGLCDAYGETLDSQFMAYYVGIVRNLPSKSSYESQLDTMLDYVAEHATDYPEYVQTPQEHLRLWNFFESVVPGGGAFVTPVEHGSSGGGAGVTANAGRARYLVAGHSWANARSFNDGGSCRTTVSLDATFEIQNALGDALKTVPKSKQKGNTCKVVVTGLGRFFLESAVEPPLPLITNATGAAFGDTDFVTWTGLTT